MIDRRELSENRPRTRIIPLCLEYHRMPVKRRRLALVFLNKTLGAQEGHFGGNLLCSRRCSVDVRRQPYERGGPCEMVREPAHGSTDHERRQRRQEQPPMADKYPP